MDRIASLVSHGKTLGDINRNIYEVAKINQQVSSGLIADSYDDLNGIVERVSANQSKLSRVNNYLQNNTTVETSLNAYDISLDQIQKALETFSTNLALRRSAVTSEQINFQQLAQTALDKLTASLNSTSGGRYIFSGTQSDLKPVPQTPGLGTDGNVNMIYYKGNNEIMTARIADNRQLEYGINANDPAFEAAFKAILTAKEGDASNDPEKLQQAVDLLKTAVSDMAAVRARVSTDMSAVEDMNEEHQSMKIYWKQALSDDTETDIGEASIRLAQHETILQATYQVFALTSQLKLADYLR